MTRKNNMSNIESVTKEFINVLENYNRAITDKEYLSGKSLSYLMDYVKRNISSIDVFMKIDGKLGLLELAKNSHENIIDIIIRNNIDKINSMPEKYDLMEILVMEKRPIASANLVSAGWRINQEDEKAKKFLEFMALSGDKLFFQLIARSHDDFNFALEVTNRQTLRQIAHEELMTNPHLDSLQKVSLEDLIKFLKKEESKSLTKILEKDLDHKEIKVIKTKI
jgi:hypothetical protein